MDHYQMLYESFKHNSFPKLYISDLENAKSNASNNESNDVFNTKSTTHLSETSIMNLVNCSKLTDDIESKLTFVKSRREMSVSAQHINPNNNIIVQHINRNDMLKVGGMETVHCAVNYLIKDSIQNGIKSVEILPHVVGVDKYTAFDGVDLVISQMD